MEDLDEVANSERVRDGVATTERERVWVAERDCVAVDERVLVMVIVDVGKGEIVVVRESVRVGVFDTWLTNPYILVPEVLGDSDQVGVLGQVRLSLWAVPVAVKPLLDIVNSENEVVVEIVFELLELRSLGDMDQGFVRLTVTDRTSVRVLVSFVGVVDGSLDDADGAVFVVDEDIDEVAERDELLEYVNQLSELDALSDG